MKGDIILTRDVEVIEMNEMGAGGTDDKGATWKVSAKQVDPPNMATTWIDGFRRAEVHPRRSRSGGYQQTSQPAIPAAGDNRYDLVAASAKTANTALARELKGRHLQMIAFGGAIGKSSSKAISRDTA